jgi:hypothetical protein
MKNSLIIAQMTTEEKIQTMETLWEDLCRKAEDVPSPLWHKGVLQEREERIKTGEEVFLDWESAKKQIREKVL